MTLERNAERDRPEPAGGDIGGVARAPSVTRHLARVSARALDMQSLDGARNLGRQVGPLACENQRFDEQDKAVGSQHAIDKRARVGLRGAGAGRRFLGALGDMEHVAASGLDEERLLGTKVVSDLAREGIGRASDRGDGGAAKAVRLEEFAGRVEEARAHALAGRACCTRAVSGRTGTGRA